MGSVTKKYKTPLQLILFGSPGTGKSHKVENIIAADLNVIEISTKEKAAKFKEQVVNTVFHPEYTYGDFMGKLMPLTDESGKVTYRYYPGHFMQALAWALKHYHDNCETPKNVLLVIDEINRGNSAAIFGTVFQLLDRAEPGWSSYEVNVSEMERKALLELMGYHRHPTCEGEYSEVGKKDFKDLKEHFNGDMSFLVERKIKLPPNLSIVGTMNTSDESIYYMDSAFKRRWSWEYVPVKADVDKKLEDVKIENLANETSDVQWKNFVDRLNKFITSHHKSIRKVEDKQIGYRFITAKDGKIQITDIQNKLMFFLWDTVFARNKEPLENLLSVGKPELVTFSDFSDRAATFIEKIKNFPTER